MGLFSKKEYICSKCGKIFTKRVNRNCDLCGECWNEQEKEKEALSKSISGYIQYAERMYFKEYSTDDMKKIIERRYDILEKYRKKEFESKKSNVENVGKNYTKLTDAQAEEVIEKISRIALNAPTCHYYSGTFLLPEYSNVIVDVEDVFAVGYTTAYGMLSEGPSREAIMCAFFTNDPYIPVFPIVYAGKIGRFELIKSKAGRTEVASMMESLCPNLQYPVVDIVELEKQIKAEGVRGKLDMKFVMEQIWNAKFQGGVFNIKEIWNVFDLYV